MAHSNQRTGLATGASLVGIAVIAGAMGAHALKPLLETQALESYETAVRYQVYHGLALLILNGIGRASQWSNRLMITGTLLFSGSIFVLSTDELMGISASFLGPVTPLGGVLLIASWAVIVNNILREKSQK